MVIEIRTHDLLSRWLLMPCQGNKLNQKLKLMVEASEYVISSKSELIRRKISSEKYGNIDYLTAYTGLILEPAILTI